MASKQPDPISIPVPPADAQQFQTGCKYCIVGCGYKVYKWPLGKSGGASPKQNAFGIDLRNPNLTHWISPSMHSIVEDRDGRSYNVAIIPDDTCVVNSGLNSVRGGTMGLSVYRSHGPTADRLNHPLVWAHGHQEASWEDAVEIVARVTKELLTRDGPDAIGVKFADHGGQGGGYEFTWSTGKFFYHSVRTTMATVHNRPTVFGEPMASRDMGIPELNIAYEDAEIADTIVIFGADPYSDQTNYYLNHMVPNLQGSTENKKKQHYPGKAVAPGRMIVVDPRRTVTVTSARAAAGADRVLHMQVNPGMDVTLMNAIARVIVEHGWENEAFIRDHVEAESVAPYEEVIGKHRSLEDVLSEAERDAGVPKAEILKAAEWIAKPIGGHAPATLFHYEKGAIWSIKNYQVIASYVDLAVLTGNLGKPGTGCARLGGHQEGYARPPYPGKRPGVYVEQLLAEGKGPKMWWFIGCNPIQTAPNSSSIAKFMDERGASVKQAMDAGGSIDERVKRIIDALDRGGLFIVGQDIYPTESVKRAHVVFPAATQFEVDMTSINGERRMRLYQKFMDPPGAAKPDWEIMALAARRIQALLEADGHKELADRFAGYDWKTPADVFLDGARASAAGRQGEPVEGLPQSSKPTFDPEDISFLDHAFILSKGINGIQVPINVVNGERRGTVRLFEDGKFARPSGRTAFIPAKQPPLPPDVARQRAKYKYLINNGRFDAMWQTGYETWRKPVIAQRWGGTPGAFLELNVHDAKSLGVSSGDVLRIHNDYASITCTAYVSDTVKPGAPFLLFAQVRGTADFVVTPSIDPETNIPYYKGTYASIERVAPAPSSMKRVSFKPMDVVTT